MTERETIPPRTWRTWAGRVSYGSGFADFGHPRFVKMNGHSEVVPVELVEDENGMYYGWLYSQNSPYERNNRFGPCMVQPHRGMYDMQFPYGAKAEEEAGVGETVKLAVRELSPEEAAEGMPAL